MNIFSLGFYTLTDLNITLFIVHFVAFSANEAGEISLELEQYLKSVATTGQTLYVVLYLAKTGLYCMSVYHVLVFMLYLISLFFKSYFAEMVLV